MAKVRKRPFPSGGAGRPTGTCRAALCSLLATASLTLLSPAAARAAPAADADGRTTNRELVQTQVEHSFLSTDYLTATQLLTEHLVDDPTDSNAWNLLGLSAAAQGSHQEAVRAFESAILNGAGESRAIYLYNLAEALTKAGDLKRARAALDRLSSFQPRARPLIAEARVAIEKKAPFPAFRLEDAPTYRLIGSIVSGYDTNVLLLSDAGVASLTSTGAASFNVTPTLSFTRVGQAFGKPFSLTAGGTSTIQLATEARAFTSVTGLTSAAWGTLPGNDRFRWGWLTDFDFTLLNTAGLQFFNWNASTRAALVFGIGQTSQLEIETPVRYQKFAETSDPANDRSGIGLRPRMTFRTSLGRSHRIGIGGRMDLVLAKGNNFDSTTITPLLQWTWVDLPLQLSSNLNVEASLVDYANASQLREDKNLAADWSLGRPFGKGFFVSIDYGFRRNVSTLSTAQYTKHSVGLGVSYAL
jgi:tetratricopeptide (TPR) repeat protein